MIAGAHYGLEGLPQKWLNKLDKNIRNEIEGAAVQLIDLSPFKQQSHQL